jgi:predicted O-methyltransferase YrrM
MAGMSYDGTRAHLTGPGDLPPLVERAARTARHLGFPYSCRPEQGRLLRALAAGARRIGETGTGCGVGLAWLVSGMPREATAVSVERDETRAATAAALFAELAPAVAGECADWTAIAAHGPFDLLVLDGGGRHTTAAEAGAGPDPADLLRPGGVLVIDDFTPSPVWPPRYDGEPDEARLHWLGHPALRTVELPLAPDLAVLVATRRPEGDTP